MTYYVLIVKDSPIEEICGVTSDKALADWWVAGELGGLAPKRITRSFEMGFIEPSALEHKWSSHAEQ